MGKESHSQSQSFQLKDTFLEVTDCKPLNLEVYTHDFALITSYAKITV